MKRLQELSKEINDLTLKIEQEYPDLYQHLDETPITIPYYEHPGLNTRNFPDLLDRLKHMLKDQIENYVRSQKKQKSIIKISNQIID